MIIDLYNYIEWNSCSLFWKDNSVTHIFGSVCTELQYTAYLYDGKM